MEENCQNFRSRWSSPARVLVACFSPTSMRTLSMRATVSIGSEVVRLFRFITFVGELIHKPFAQHQQRRGNDNAFINVQ